MSGNVAASVRCKIGVFLQGCAWMCHLCTAPRWSYGNGSFCGNRGARVVLGRYGQSDRWQAALRMVSVQFREQTFKLKKEILLSAACLGLLSGSFPCRRIQGDKNFAMWVLLTLQWLSCSHSAAFSFACNWEYSALLQKIS